jgi:hypothetical protein
MNKIGKIVGVLVFLMIVGTSMVTAAEGADTSVKEKVDDPVDWDDSIICMGITENSGNTEVKSSGSEIGDHHDYNDGNIILSGDNNAIPQKTDDNTEDNAGSDTGADPSHSELEVW